MSVHLGVDVGSTRTKLIAWDAAADLVVARASLPTPVVVGEIERRDHTAVWRTLEQLAQSIPTEVRRSIRGVSVASVGEEIVLLDEDGRSIMPTPCWYALDPSEEGPLDPLLSWHHFAFLRRHEPDRLAGASNFTDVGSHVAMRLAGLSARESVMDRSHASRTGLLGHDGMWDTHAFARSGAVAVGAAPRLVESGDAIGSVARDVAEAWGLSADVEVRAGGHDHFCGALAAGASRAGDTFVSVGTSESVLQLVDRSDTGHRAEDGLESGFFVTPDLGYLHGSRPSGRRVAELLARHGLSDVDPLYRELDGEDGPESLAAIELEAELHAQARECADLVTRLAAASGIATRKVVIGGRPAAYPVWRRIRAHAIAAPVEFVQEPELAGKGAAMLAAREEVGR